MLPVVLSDADLCPGSLTETDGQEEETGYLIGKDTEPDAVEAEIEHTCQYPCDDGADQCDGNKGSEQTVLHVTGTAQTAAEDDLGNLEENDDDDVICNQYAHIQNRGILEEQGEESSSEEEQDDY